MEEIWKDIKGWEGKHQISNYGRIKTFNYMNRGNDVIREGFENDKGYLKITFSNKYKKEIHRINRLEAITFGLSIPEHLKNVPIEKLDVEHIDGNRKNNRLDNLRWTTHKENCNNPITLQRYSKSHIGLLINRKDLSKPILQIDPNTNEIIAEFPSSAEIKRMFGYNDNHIRECCNGKIKTANGYKWSFKTKIWSKY